MTELAQLNRRGFLRSAALAGGGLAIGWQIPGCARTDEAEQGGADQASPDQGESVFSPFVKITPDNRVIVISKHLDKGQGSVTGLATLVAEELDADWSQVETEFAPADVSKYANGLFGVQGTGGSTAMNNSWMQYRKAGAAARAMLVAAAAARWGAAPGDITVDKGVVSDGTRRASFGELAAAASEQIAPVEPALKDPADFSLIGGRVPRLDSKRKTDGSMQFTIDVERDEMLVAVMAHPPAFGARMTGMNAQAALAVDGVEDVVTTPRGPAVIAKSYWAAQKALEVDWDFSQAETRSSAQRFADYARTVEEERPVVARNEGDVEAALAQGADLVEARFEFPFLAHASMEPMNCVAQIKDGTCVLWTGSQLQTGDQQVAGAITGLGADNVIIHTQFAGGSFGRRAVPDSDFVAEAVMIAQAHGKGVPIKLQWAREDDMRAGRYRPMSYHVMRGAVADGAIQAWHHAIATQSFLKGSAFEGSIVDGVDSSAVEGARSLPYAVANLRVDQYLVPNGVTGLWWRSVGHTHNGYATEVFFDMLARAAGQDPARLRMALLGADKARHKGVLQLALAKAGAAPAGPGRGRGVALHESFSSFVAQVADVTVRDGALTVDRVVCAVDCGVAINPDVIVAQMEGGIGYGLSALLREEITLTDGRVDQANFDGYEALRIYEMPDIDVHIVPSAEHPTGVGEPGTPPIGPAVANAVAAATGRVVTKLPFGSQLTRT